MAEGAVFDVDDVREEGIPALASPGADDPALRPTDLDGFIGQERARRILSMVISSARARGDFVGHVLLQGPPGLGKTTLARIVAAQTGGAFRSLSGPALQKVTDMGPVLVNIVEREVLFIDEIHRMPASVGEMAYTAMEDFRIDLIVGQPGSTRAVTIDLPRFTLVGATTAPGMLPTPLRERFDVHVQLDPYTDEELVRIATRSARLLGMDPGDEVMRMVAMRSRGTPRIVNRLVRRLRDAGAEAGVASPGAELANMVFDLLGIDERGLDDRDRRYLDLLNTRFKGGPTGVASLATALGEDVVTLQNEIEPWLIRQGFLERTSRGRMLPEAREGRLL